MEPVDKKNKVRTSITIDPDLLREVKAQARTTSVSSFVEAALRDRLKRLEELQALAEAAYDGDSDVG